MAGLVRDLATSTRACATSIFVIIVGVSSYTVRMLDIDPRAQGTCPTGLQLETVTGGEVVCTRTAHPSSSVIVDAQSVMETVNSAKGSRRYSRLNGTIRAFQKGAPEAFEPGSRDSSGIDSSDYVDGLSITRGSPRTHVFTLALSASYDTALGAGICPCGSGTATLVCSGSAPTYVENGYVCESGNYGAISLDWESRELLAEFDHDVNSSDEHIEVRLMFDQPNYNEDIGISVLQIDAEEIEDVDPPVIHLSGSATDSIYVETSYQDPGASCFDDVDGALTLNVSGAVDPSAPGVQVIVYSCQDTRGNLASASRTVTVLDNVPPTVALRGDSRQCVQEGEPYREYGALCLDNIDGSTEATVTGNVDTTVTGSTSLTYSCEDSSYNKASSTRRVVVSSSAMPGSLHVELMQLETSATGLLSSTGSRSLLTNVKPSTTIQLKWSEAFTLNTEECRFLRIVEHSTEGLRSQMEIESWQLGLVGSVDGTLLTIASDVVANLSSGGLADSTTYSLMIDEHFVRAVSGSSEGNVHQVLSFVTGDYTGPSVSAVVPADGELAFPVTGQVVSWRLDEAVQPSLSPDHVNITQLETGARESVPCNGSLSAGGLQLLFDSGVVALQLQGWGSWEACRDYRLEVPAGCFLDLSLNANPSLEFNASRFLTSCILTTSPADGSTGVPLDSPITISFSEAVELGPGDIHLQPLGEEELLLSAASYPMVHTAGKDLVLDLACVTDRCQVFWANGTGSSSSALTADGTWLLLNSSLGLCNGRALERCKGKVHYLSLGASAVRRVTGQWPEGSLLAETAAEAGAGLPAQLEGGLFHFALKEADWSPPSFLHLSAEATSAGSILLAVALDEAGVVHCAAFREWGAGLCEPPVLLEEEESSQSQGHCSNATLDTCANCENPSFGCFNTSAMWVDDGCAGTFLFQGRELACHSWESESTVYDGSSRTVLTLGWRHACSIHRSASASYQCWGNVDNIGTPPLLQLYSISAGYMHTCGIQSSARIQCWGTNLYGETAGPGSDSSAFRTITSGYRFSCALRSNDSLAECWGLNDAGQATPPSGISFLAISAGYRHVCGIRQNDTAVQCWGWDSDGQLQAPGAISFLARGPGGTPLPEATISSGWRHSCAIREDTGEVLCWGADDDNQASPPAGAFVQVSVGWKHSCALHKTLPDLGIVPNASVSCWGRDDYGQASPPAEALFSAIASGDDYSCGIGLHDHLLVCWGRDDYGQATPPAIPAGVLDEFMNVTCGLDTFPSYEEVLGHVGSRDAGASVEVVLSEKTRRREASLELGGLVSQSLYWVYCSAEDEELPSPNRISDMDMIRQRQAVSTLDTQSVVLQSLTAGAISAEEVSVTASLSEPGVIYCSAVPDRAGTPSALDVVLFGSQSQSQPVGSSASASSSSDPENLATVTLAGLLPDTEYDIFCAAHDTGVAAGSLEFAEEATLVERDAHTLRDSTLPVIVGQSPADGDLFFCLPDNFSPGCITSLALSFNEDVHPGPGNLSLVCTTNLAFCEDVHVPLLAGTFEGGISYFQGKQVHIDFTSPLVDASTFKVTVDRGSILDAGGNAFELDEVCESWFDQASLTSPRPCGPAYTVHTPS